MFPASPPSFRPDWQKSSTKHNVIEAMKTRIVRSDTHYEVAFSPGLQPNGFIFPDC